LLKTKVFAGWDLVSWPLPDFIPMLRLLEHSRIFCGCFKAQLNLTSYEVYSQKSPLTGITGCSFSKFPFMARHSGKCTVCYLRIIRAKYEVLDLLCEI